MTAEIVIMNKEAIAIAADSAVTMIEEGGQKIKTSANKVFTLSKYHPVGIMVYGGAIFMGIPWETIIKIYRNKLGKKRFDTLNEYTEDFIKFLDNGNPLFPSSLQDDYLKSSIYAYFNFIKIKIKEEVESKINEKGEISNKEIKKIVSEIIKEDYRTWNETDNISSIPEKYNRDIIDKYGKIIDESIEEIFEELPMSKILSDKLKKIATSLFSKFPEGVQKSGISGLVITGFGDKETFPSVKSFFIEGVVNDRLKYKEDGDRSMEINFKSGASIIPFAQSEMVEMFMEGIDPFYRNIEKNYLSEVFSKYAEIIIDSIEKYSKNEKNKLKKKLNKMTKKILNDHNEKLENYRKRKYIIPVINVVTMLPKDELAAMAESLVNLTSFKRKVTMESETVGGPIDVAVISKGDGFIWIKRKHYFKGELNPQFFANYYRGVGYEKE